MQRRQFIKQSTATLGLLSLSSIPMYSFEKNNTKHITILHTNDVHSHIDPFPANDSRNPNQGGVARRASLIQQIRQEPKIRKDFY
jgi:5'-nucleotidase